MRQRVLARMCRTVTPGAIVSVLAVGVVSGCTGGAGSGDGAAGPTPSGEAPTSADAPPSASAEASAPASDGATASATAGGAATVSLVSCRENTCTVTLGGAGSLVRVFDTTIAFVGIDEGTATLRVEDQEVSCREGAGVPAGSLQLECTGVTEDTVEFTAEPR